MRKFLASGRRRYALVLFVIASSLVLMAATCEPIKEPTKEPAPPAPAPTGLSIEPTAHEFPDTPIDDVSDPQTFTVTNHGPDTSGFLSVNVFSSDFLVPGIGDGCTGAQLDPGEMCTLGALFKPLTAGVPLSTNLVVSGDPGGSATATLTGIGLHVV